MRIRPLRTAVAVAVVASSARAQEPSRPPIPQIMTNAQGEVRVAPDRALVSIGVQTRAATAADAAAQNSRKQSAVINAIKARGIAAEQIQTSGFNVMPETRYDREGGAPRVTSYLVINTVNVEVRRIDLVGAVLDAALGAGANQINSLNFTVANPDSARRAALGHAVAKAKADAETMARAAGGSLGPLLEMTAGEVYVPPPRPVMAMARAAVAQDTNVPVEAGEEIIRASVSTRWQFLSGPPR